MRVLLGAKANSLFDVRLPTIASPKVDGWRALWQGLEFFTRTGKTIPNRSLPLLAHQAGIPPGYDGEIIVGEPTARDCFSKTDSFCKRQAGRTTLPVRFFVFDNCAAIGGFHERLQTLIDIPPFVVRLEQKVICTYEELVEYEAYCVGLGYEGIVCRSPTGRYKQGRSTLREQYLVKVKRYIDEEVKIIGFKERMHNANTAEVNEIGYTHRSSHKENKVPLGTLGAIIVDWRGKVLHVGTGWDAATGRSIWQNRDSLLGATGTIKYSPEIKDLPRQPVWKGIRND